MYRILYIYFLSLISKLDFYWRSKISKEGPININLWSNRNLLLTPQSESSAESIPKNYVYEQKVPKQFAIIAACNNLVGSDWNFKDIFIQSKVVQQAV